MAVNKTKIFPFSLALIATLGGCGGGAGGNDLPPDNSAVDTLHPPLRQGVEAEPLPSTHKEIRGMLVTPLALGAADNSSCDGIPKGYEPLANSEVSVRNIVGTQISTVTTQSCGDFVAEVADEAQWLTLDDGPRLRADVADFMPGLEGIASSFHRVEIATLHTVPQSADNGSRQRRIYFSVIDSNTQRPVLGWPSRLLTFRNGAVNGGETFPFHDYANLGTAGTDPLSAEIVLYDSGPHCHVFPDDNSDFDQSDACQAITSADVMASFTRVANAGHHLIALKNPHDSFEFTRNGMETAEMVGSSLYVISTNTPISGFGGELTDASLLHLFPDIFNPFSDLYALTSTPNAPPRLVQRHKDNADRLFMGDYLKVGSLTGDLYPSAYRWMVDRSTATESNEARRPAAIYLLGGSTTPYPGWDNPVLGWESVSTVLPYSQAGAVPVFLDLNTANDTDPQLQRMATIGGGYYLKMAATEEQAALGVEVISGILRFEYVAIVDEENTEGDSIFNYTTAAMPERTIEYTTLQLDVTDLSGHTLAQRKIVLQ